VITEQEALRLKRAQNGDAAAFEEFVRENEKTVYRLALRTLGSREDAEDAAQETFLKAFASLRAFRGESSVKVWLCRIARNVCIDALRRRRETVSLTTEDESGETAEREIADMRADPAGIAERRDLQERVAAAVRLLPAEQREAFLLRAVAGCSYEEIAATLDTDLGTVKSRIFRARKKLAGILAETGNFSPPPASKRMKEGERA